MIKKIAVVLVIALALLISLTACGGPHKGVITNKSFQDSYYYPVQYCASYNSKGLCSMYMTRMDYMPPSWQFDLKDGKDHGWRSVTQDTYNRYQVGDYFTDGNDE